jgi:hypothetical protein
MFLGVIQGVWEGELISALAQKKVATPMYVELSATGSIV